MKIFIYILLACCTGLLIFNLTQVQWADPFAGDASVAVIGVLACACGILLLIILLLARRAKKLARRQ